MGFETHDWLKSFNKGSDCSSKNSYSCSYSKSKGEKCEKSCKSKDEKCEKSCHSENKECKEQCCETIKKQCPGENKCVQGKCKKVVQEKCCKVRHINKVYIQPVCKTFHEKKTFVYRLPTKYIEDCCAKDLGTEYVKVNKCQKKC